MSSSSQSLEETRSLLGADTQRLGAPRLVAIWPGGSSSVVLPADGELKLGRGIQCQLRIDDATVSREHAVIRAGEEPVLIDLGSSNGTRVAGQKVAPQQPVALRSNALIELGSALVVLQRAGATSEAPAPGVRSPAATLAPPAAGAELDSPMAAVLQLADLVATADISAIILGETGVGKELLARRVHERSPRADKPFIRINCAAFAESVVESELFGYERGAFTGASSSKPGLLEAAHGGSVLLDEVGELPLGVQAKLLRALGNQEVLRIGALTPRTIDVRFVAATHRDLEQMVAQGSFRADLYFRLNGISLNVPPLRERRDEIIQLAATFCREQGAEPTALSAEARAQLLAHHWPGNIRELKSVVQRALLLSRGGPVAAEHLGLGAADAAVHAAVAPEPAGSGAPLTVSAAPSDLRGDVQALEKQRILDALEACAGNQTQAAKRLGISRRSLLHRLDAYAIPRPRKGRRRG